MNGHNEPAGGQPLLTREILTLAAVVVLGGIMTILDATIVNVALPTLGRDFRTSISTIQWVPTIYLLAFASVIPASGSAAELIGFRVLQGLGGGMIMPVGQAILARAAGPQRMGRVMSIIGVPLLLGPVVGPVIGGALVSGASWRWIFLVNLPVGAAALALALWLLPDTARRPTRLDVPGLILLSGGIAGFLYGLAKVGTGAGGGALPVASMAAGLAMVAAFCWYALRVPKPLIDLRLLRSRGFAAAAAANLMLGIALFGVALLLPLYLEIVRGRTPLQTGLLLIPQGLGAALAMPVAGALTDRIGARPVVLGGIMVALAGTAAYTQITAGTPYWYLTCALLLIGIGMGATITPSIAAADPARALPALASAFGATFWVALALTAASLVPALALPGRRTAAPQHPAAPQVQHSPEPAQAHR